MQCYSNYGPRPGTRPVWLPGRGLTPKFVFSTIRDYGRPTAFIFHYITYHPIFLIPYHFLQLVSFLGANRTKSASVGPRLLRGAI